jgi:hypothetical protein
VSSITNYSARSRSEFCSTTQNGPELPPHREHGTFAGGEHSPAMSMTSSASSSPLGTRSQGACARAAISTARRARTLVVHAELPYRVAQPTRGRRRGRVAGRFDRCYMMLIWHPPFDRWVSRKSSRRRSARPPFIFSLGGCWDRCRACAPERAGAAGSKGWTSLRSSSLAATSPRMRKLLCGNST